MIDRFWLREFAQYSDMELQTAAGLMILSTGLHKHIAAVSGRSSDKGLWFEERKQRYTVL
jgi:hypothetical protein